MHYARILPNLLLSILTTTVTLCTACGPQVCNACIIIHYYYYYIRDLKVFSRCENVAKDQNTREYLAWSAVNGDPMHEVVYPTQSISRMRTARVKEEVRADTRIIVKE